jgi:hypothetical protein
MGAKPNLAVVNQFTSRVWKKPNEKRKRKSTSDRDTSKYSERNASEDDKYHVVFLSETRATTCYGCEQ